MKKKILSALFTVISLLMLFCVSLAGCNSDPDGTREIYYSFLDSEGRQVNLYDKPQRVAVLLSSYAEIWQLSGGETSITVGDSVERGFASQNAVLVDDGAGLKIDVEKLVFAKPDFIIGSVDTPAHVEACKRLRELQIPCALFSEDNFEDYLYILKIFCEINGNGASYDIYGTALRSEIDEIKRNAEEYTLKNPVTSVLFIRAGSGGSATRAKTAENHFTGVMLKELCTFNIADEAKQLSEALSLEHILINQPDVIFITPQGDENAAISYMQQVLSQPGWQELNAVKNNKVYFLPKSMFNYKPNAKWAKAYEYLYNLLYGESGV